MQPLPAADPELELSIVMPCLDEAETLGRCIDKAGGFLRRHGIAGEIVVADNGSGDGSREIAREKGARVVSVAERGYGAALIGGIGAARGRYVIMGDADDSYDFSRLEPFLEKLREGYALVMGNRFQGGIAPGAMPWLHRYLGNPVLSLIGRVFFGSPIGDFHCGLRGFSREAIQGLDLRTTGMEFASEMVVKATLARLPIAEVPTTLSPDGRSRPPHIRTWRDGWRHLRFLLMYSPRWLFLYPGLAMMGLGLLGFALLLPGTIVLLGVHLDVHTLLVASGAVIIGAQTVTAAVLVRQFAVNQGLLPPSPRLEALLRRVSLERALIGGVVFVVAGAAGVVAAFVIWQATDFGPLDYRGMMRLVIPSVTSLVLGFQMVVAGFFSSILDLKVQGDPRR